MEYRSLDLTVISADDLKDVNMFSKMDVYVLVTILGYPKNNKRTHVDRNAGTSPRWNHRMKFTIDEPSLQNPSLCILFQLRSDRSFGGDRDIGEVTVPIQELFSNAGASDSAERVADYQVKTASGKAKGTLKISFKFGEKFSQQADAKNKGVDEPMTGLPVAGQAASAPGPGPGPGPKVGTGMAYPQPQYPGMGYGTVHAFQQAPMGYGYGYGYGGYAAPGPHGYPHAASGYGYAAPPPGYGYAPAPMQPMNQPKKNKGKKGLGAAGLGLGLGAGLLGGLMVGEAVSDVEEMAAYDEGYGDAMEDVTGGFGSNF